MWVTNIILVIIAFILVCIHDELTKIANALRKR